MNNIHKLFQDFCDHKLTAKQLLLAIRKVSFITIILSLQETIFTVLDILLCCFRDGFP